MVDVIQRGTDTSGRAIKASEEMWAVWDAACAALGFTPTIVQGGWVGNDGADASAETHAGDAFDVRLWDRTAEERAEMIRVFRSHALAYWERYESQGFDLHAHMVPGLWGHPSGQALGQWNDYLNARNGLASNGPDYHWRPFPLITTPPPEDDMFETDDRKRLERIENEISDLAAAEAKRAKDARDRDRRNGQTIRKAIKAGKLEVLAALADELDPA